MTARPPIDLGAPPADHFRDATKMLARRPEASSLHTSDGAWHVTGRRCEPITMRSPAADAEADEAWALHRQYMASQRASSARLWRIADAAACIVLVLVLAALALGWL